MSNQIVAGIDIHKDFLVVTVLRHKDKFVKEYSTHYKALYHLKRWMARLKVTQVAIEATGIYMIPCCDVLKDRFEMFMVNAQRTKHIPGKKTDAIDSAWLATLLQKDLLTKSYIAPRIWREIREMVRQRISQTQTKTRAKNRLHKLLITEGFYLSRIYSDICGNTSRLIIESLTEGMSVKEILEKYHTNAFIRRHRDKIIELLPNSKRLTESISLMIQLILNEIDECELRIQILEDAILKMTQVDAESAEELKIIMTVPGFSLKSAKSVLSEIGDITRFPRGKNFVSYAGLAPGIYESGGKKKRQRITKRGNKYLRTSFVEAAHAAARNKKSRLHGYFIRIQKRIGRKKAIVALACKLMRIVHTLLVRKENYEEDHFKKDAKLLILPEPKQVIPLKELDLILKSRGLRISIYRR